VHGSRDAAPDEDRRDEHRALIPLRDANPVRSAPIVNRLLLAVNLALVVAFEVTDPGFRWLYYLGVLVNAQVIVSGAGPYAVSRFHWVPSFLR